jgi:hypothetical protein
MTNWIKGTTPTFDFYDRLLFRYYGKVVYGYDMADDNSRDYTVVMYYWNGKYYIDEVKYD